MPVEQQRIREPESFTHDILTAIQLVRAHPGPCMGPH